MSDKFRPTENEKIDNKNTWFLSESDIVHLDPQKLNLENWKIWKIKLNAMLKLDRVYYVTENLPDRTEKSSEWQKANARAIYLIRRHLDPTTFSLPLKIPDDFSAYDLLAALETVYRHWKESDHRSNIDMQPLFKPPSAPTPPTEIEKSEYTRRSPITDHTNLPKQKLIKPKSIPNSSKNAEENYQKFQNSMKIPKIHVEIHKEPITVQTKFSENQLSSMNNEFSMPCHRRADKKNEISELSHRTSQNTFFADMKFDDHTFASNPFCCSPNFNDDPDEKSTENPPILLYDDSMTTQNSDHFFAQEGKLKPPDLMNMHPQMIFDEHSDLMLHFDPAENSKLNSPSLLHTTQTCKQLRKGTSC